MDSVPADSAAPIGRRERNKQQKLDRITAAADSLFAIHGVDEVTTQQIADAADIGTGTLFLYARSKAELLLLVQNGHYADAIAEGIHDAASHASPLEAVVALVRPIVACNRRRIDNGRTYLRELVFGDPEEPHHRVGLQLLQRADDAFVEILLRTRSTTPTDARLLARTISAVMFICLASPMHVASSNDEICDDLRDQVRVLLR